MSPVHHLTRIARRTLDVLLVILILFVLATVIVARLVPQLTGGQAFVVGGGSMEPTIPIGSVVLALPVPAAELREGDVVSVRAGPDRAVYTHRITRLVVSDGEQWLGTKGDANEDPDPTLVPASAVIGRVDTSIPYAGYAVKLLSTSQGVLFLVAMGVFVLAAAWLLESLEIDQELARARRALRALGAEPVGERSPG